MKGALLVLNEQTAIACCDVMRRDVEAHGMPAIREPIDAFWRVMTEIVARYRCKTEQTA